VACREYNKCIDLPAPRQFQPEAVNLRGKSALRGGESWSARHAASSNIAARASCIVGRQSPMPYRIFASQICIVGMLSSASWRGKDEMSLGGGECSVFQQGSSARQELSSGRSPWDSLKSRNRGSNRTWELMRWANYSEAGFGQNSFIRMRTIYLSSWQLT
jgi:hypothetical protein